MGWPGRPWSSWHSARKETRELPAWGWCQRRVVSSKNRSLELPNISDACLEAATKEAGRVIIITEKDKGSKASLELCFWCCCSTPASGSAPGKPRL